MLQTAVINQLTLATHFTVSSQRIENADFTENYSLSKVNVMTEARELDDFCPRAELLKVLERCGKPDLAHKEVVSNDRSYKVIPMDRINTMENVLNGVESLVEPYVGVYLKEEVINQAGNCARKKLLAATFS